MTARTFDAESIVVGHSYVIALANDVFARATVTFERTARGQRFVRFTSPSLKQPGYCTAEKFAASVRGVC